MYDRHAAGARAQSLKRTGLSPEFLHIFFVFENFKINIKSGHIESDVD